MSKWRICPRCEGEGQSSAYLGAYSAEEFQASFSDEEAEQYMSGGYDRPCEECGGTGKVTREDEAEYASRRADLYQQWLEDGRPDGSFSAWAGC